MNNEIIDKLDKMNKGSRAPKGYRHYEQALVTALSIRNAGLLFCQNPKATDVRGMKAWNDEHRIIRKGSKASYIVAPTVLDEDGRALEFGDVKVFDIADTELMTKGA
jgi:hypothetical protein